MQYRSLGYFFAERKDGKTELRHAYHCTDFPFKEVSLDTISVTHGARKKTVFNDFGTFDIESTTLPRTPTAFMYHWQMCVSGILVYGRTWSEFRSFMGTLNGTLHAHTDAAYIIYVHNLAFEFHWIRQLFPEDVYGKLEVFAPQRRKPLTLRLPCGIEFRCSYKLTNMSLYRFTTSEYNNDYIKSDGDLDYNTIRYPDTPLTDLEFSYCMNDVLSLYTAIHAKMENDNDTLLTIPLTSTSYVRRECRARCRADKTYRNLFNRCIMTPTVYNLIKDASRGGDTGANRYLAGAIIPDVDSFDVTSSYPFQMLTKEYPISRFYLHSTEPTLEDVETISQKKACLFRIGFKNLRIKPEAVDAYLPTSKSLGLIKYKQANGRVLSAEQAVYTVTEVDWSIIKDTYDWDELYLGELYTAKRGNLPKPIRETVIHYFVEKCKLAIKRDSYAEDSEDYEYYNYLYAKMKNKLNGIFGMMFTDPVRDIITVNDAGIWKVDKANIPTALEDFYDSYNSFLVYAWGVYTTAHARRHLQDLLHLTGEQTIYWDTDSSKAHITPEILTAIKKANEHIIEICKKHDAYYIDRKTKRAFYLGVYEHETAKASYANFKTLGAKKYAYTDRKNRLHCTISGVAKSRSPLHPDGARELRSIEKFRIGFIFHESGGKTLYYNHAPFHTETINGHAVEVGDNVAMVDSTYRIGVTREYAEVLGYSVVDGKVYD